MGLDSFPITQEEKEFRLCNTDFIWISFKLYVYAQLCMYNSNSKTDLKYFYKLKKMALKNNSIH